MKGYTVTEPVRIEQQGHVGIIEFSRPPVNYFDYEMMHAICNAADELIDNHGSRAIVLCSTGKHFCAGADFSGDGIGDNRVAVTDKIYEEAIRLFGVRVPIIAAIQGAAVGGGLGVACAADFRIGTPSSRLHANFSSLGFHPGFGLSVSLPQILGHQKALEVFYASPRLKGEEAYEIGLLDRLVDEEDLRNDAVAFAQRIAEQAPLAVQSIKKTLRGDLPERVREVLERERAEQARLWETQDSDEGIAAAQERRTPQFIGG